ncbi:MAG: BatA domain-containing protein [Candidatus Brocadiia bacterium]
MLYPLYLLGMLGAAIPVIIHMIHKRKAQRVLFPTIRFLKASNERTSRRQKIQDLFLLLLRCLLLILLALALAEPFLGAQSLGITEQVHAVILLDNSYSMGTLHEAAPRFKTAKEMAARVVDNFSGNCRATLMLAAPPQDYPPPLLTGDTEKLRARIHEAPLSEARADLAAAIDRAREALADDPAPTLEIYVLTDLQKNAWTPVPQEKDKEEDREGPEANVVIIDCGRDGAANAAVDDVVVRGGIHIRGRPVTVEATVRNYAPAPADLNVELHLRPADRRGQPSEKDNQPLTVGADDAATLQFTYDGVDQPGVHVGWIEIDEDALEVDNRRFFAIDIHDHIPALIVREAQGALPQLDPAFYIRSALDPFALTSTPKRSLIRTTAIPLADLTPEHLRGSRLVFLVDPGGFTREQYDTRLSLLRGYVRRGGDLVIFCGPSIQPADLNLFLNGEAGEDPLMPLTLQEPRRGIIDRTQYKSIIINPAEKSHPALAQFQDPRLPGTVKVYNYVPAVVPKGSPARTLIELSSRFPFLLENHFGSGRVLLFTTTTDPEWSNLAAARFFLPLLHRVVYYLAEREDVRGRHLVGSPVNVTLRQVDRPVTVRVIPPGQTEQNAKELEAKPTPAGTQATFQHTDRRGPYSYLVLDPQAPAEDAEPQGPPEAHDVFVVNLDARESDIERTDFDALEARLGGRNLHFVDRDDDLAATIERMRKGVPLRNLLLYVVLFIAIFETFFANRVVPALQRSQEAAAAAAPTAPAPAES